MWKHWEIEDADLAEMLKSGEIAFGGNLRSKIYGRLDCSFGKRLFRTNRVFFGTAEEARNLGFRPCGHCLRREYELFLQGAI